MEHLLSQPNDQRDCQVLTETIIFRTPSQPNLDFILDNDWIIKLAAMRQSDGVESNISFEFSYLTHPVVYGVDKVCVFCDLNL